MPKNDRPVLSPNVDSAGNAKCFEYLRVAIQHILNGSMGDPSIVRWQLFAAYNIKLLVLGLRWKVFKYPFSDFWNSFTESGSSCYWDAIQMYDQNMGSYYMRGIVRTWGTLGPEIVLKYLKYVLSVKCLLGGWKVFNSFFYTTRFTAQSSQ